MAARRLRSALTLSLVVHALGAWFLWRGRGSEIRRPRGEPPVEVVVVERPAEMTPAPAARAGPERPAAVRPSRRVATRARPTAAPGAATAEDAVVPDDDHSLLRMRERPIDLTPGADTLARALGPVEAPPAEEKPRRKPRLPGTGLTTLTPEIDEKALRLVHPRFYEVLTSAERLFRPDRKRVADEVAGDLSADTSIKRWLFGGSTGDPEALRNQVPTLACLVCVTLRPGAAAHVELSGPSGSPWFDRAATESLERASVLERPDEALDPARACYRFSAKVWRTRPDLTNLAIPFRLNFDFRVKLVSYQRLGS